MIGLNRQSTESSSWHKIACAGLALLFAVLINALGTGQALAHAPVFEDGKAADHSHADLHPIIDESNPCHHHYGLKKATNSSTSNAQPHQQNAKSPMGPDCNVCCPFETDAFAPVCWRKKYDHDWFATVEHNELVADPLYISFGSIAFQDENRAKPYDPLLNGLSGAQSEFLRTVRLLT